MDNNLDKNDTNSSTIVELISENELTAQVGQAVASLILNPAVTWAKFILTDDLPNGNMQRIPADEFDNIIKTGLHMPVKMAEGKIAEGHEDSKPVGVIAHMKKESTPIGNRIVAIAALWGLERPADIEYIRSIMDENQDVNVSWEVGFGSRDIEEGGIEVLKDVILRAVTLVKRPAYQGRTRFLAIAAEATPWSAAYIDGLPDSSFLYIEKGGQLDSEGKTFPRELRKLAVKDATGLVVPTRLTTALAELEQIELPKKVRKGVQDYLELTMAELNSGKSAYLVSFGTEQSENSETEDTLETLEQLKEQLTVKDTELATSKASIEEMSGKVAELTAQLETLTKEKESANSELEELRNFKNEIDNAKAREQRLASIKSKFSELGIERDEEYFTSNAETLLKLSDEELDFMVKDIALFANKAAEASLQEKGKGALPNIPAGGDELTTAKGLAKALKERKAK